MEEKQYSTSQIKKKRKWVLYVYFIGFLTILNFLSLVIPEYQTVYVFLSSLVNVLSFAGLISYVYGRNLFNPIFWRFYAIFAVLEGVAGGLYTEIIYTPIPNFWVFLVGIGISIPMYYALYQYGRGYILATDKNT